MELENGLYVLSADWCSKCQMIKQMLFAKAPETHEIDIDVSPEIAADLEVMSIPTIAEVVDGKATVHTGQGACMEFISKL